jgi:hypothetical protein
MPNLKVPGWGRNMASQAMKPNSTDLVPSGGFRSPAFASCPARRGLLSDQKNHVSEVNRMDENAMAS